MSDAGENFLTRGEEFYSKGQYSLAVHMFNQAEKHGKSSSTMLYHRGWSHYSNNDLEAAGRDLKKAAELEPNNWMFRGLLHKVSEGRRKSVDLSNMTAELYFMQNKERFQDGVDSKKSQDDEQAKTRDDFYRLAQIDARRGLYVEAVKNFSQAISLGMDTSDVFYGRANAYFNKAEDACEIFATKLALIDYQMAISDYTSAIIMGNKEANVFYERGSALKKRGLHEEAIRDLTQAIDLGMDEGFEYQDGKHAHPFLERGEALIELGQIAKGIVDLERVLHNDPTNAPAKASLHNARVKLKKQEEDEEDFNMTGDEWYSKGIGMIRRGEYADAVLTLTRAISEGKNGPEAYHHRAIAYYNSGTYNKALADLHMVREIDEEYADALAEIEGKVHGKKAENLANEGKYDEQIKELEQAILLSGLARYKYDLDDARKRKKTAEEDKNMEIEKQDIVDELSKVPEVVQWDDLDDEFEGVKSRLSHIVEAIDEEGEEEEGNENGNGEGGEEGEGEGNTEGETIKAGGGHITFAGLMGRLRVEIDEVNRANMALRKELAMTAAMNSLLGDGYKKLPPKKKKASKRRAMTAAMNALLGDDHGMSLVEPENQEEKTLDRLPRRMKKTTSARDRAAIAAAMALTIVKETVPRVMTEAEPLNDVIEADETADPPNKTDAPAPAGPADDDKSETAQGESKPSSSKKSNNDKEKSPQLTYSGPVVLEKQKDGKGMLGKIKGKSLAPAKSKKGGPRVPGLQKIAMINWNKTLVAVFINDVCDMAHLLPKLKMLEGPDLCLVNDKGLQQMGVVKPEERTIILSQRDLYLSRNHEKKGRWTGHIPRPPPPRNPDDPVRPGSGGKAGMSYGNLLMGNSGSAGAGNEIEDDCDVAPGGLRHVTEDPRDAESTLSDLMESAMSDVRPSQLSALDEERPSSVGGARVSTPRAISRPSSVHGQSPLVDKAKPRIASLGNK